MGETNNFLEPLYVCYIWTLDISTHHELKSTPNNSGTAHTSLHKNLVLSGCSHQISRSYENRHSSSIKTELPTTVPLWKVQMYIVWLTCFLFSSVLFNPDTKSLTNCNSFEYGIAANKQEFRNQGVFIWPVYLKEEERSISDWQQTTFEFIMNKLPLCDIWHSYSRFFSISEISWPMAEWQIIAASFNSFHDLLKQLVYIDMPYLVQMELGIMFMEHPVGISLETEAVRHNKTSQH